MSSIFMWIYLILIVVTVIFTIACFFLKKEPARDMKSKFESGIDQSEQETPPLYMHFFYIAILFLIFDMEIILSVPMIQSILENNHWSVFWAFFLSIIFLGLVLETSIDSIEWKE